LLVNLKEHQYIDIIFLKLPWEEKYPQVAFMKTKAKFAYSSLNRIEN